MVSTVLLVVSLVTPLVVLACEEECMSGITNEYHSLYNPVVLDVFQHMADRIEAQCIPPANRRQGSISYFKPVINAYNKAAIDGLEHAIFPSYFHGKCRDSNGAVPRGCPNPDCPVVCGTPGSLVHFFPVLRRLAFHQVLEQLTNATSPRSKVYEQVKKMVLHDAQTTQRRALSRVSSSAKVQARAKAAAEKNFRAIMKGFPTMFLTACGGSNLSQCSWETHMKKLILQYP